MEPRILVLPSSTTTTQIAWPDRYIGAAIISILSMMLGYCAIRIYLVSSYLQEHRNYIQARDAEWGPLAIEIRANQDRIEAHLKRQDHDAAIILEHVRKHEQFMVDHRSP